MFSELLFSVELHGWFFFRTSISFDYFETESLIPLIAADSSFNSCPDDSIRPASLSDICDEDAGSVSPPAPSWLFNSISLSEIVFVKVGSLDVTLSQYIFINCDFLRDSGSRIPFTLSFWINSNDVQFSGSLKSQRERSLPDCLAGVSTVRFLFLPDIVLTCK